MPCGPRTDKKEEAGKSHLRRSRELKQFLNNLCAIYRIFDTIYMLMMQHRVLGPHFI